MYATLCVLGSIEGTVIHVIFYKLHSVRFKGYKETQRNKILNSVMSLLKVK